MDNATTTTETPQHYAPAQYTEVLPDWVRAEVEAHREKLPELRAAIVAAILDSKGILTKSETNQDQKYKYTGFDQILDAVREPMAKAGLNMEQVSCDVETELHWSNNYGTTTVWKWRAIYLITHVSGCAVARIVRVTTSPGAKCASIASSSADRLMVTRLMRMASAKDESLPDQADRNNRSYNSGGPPHGQQRPRESRPERAPSPSPGATNGPPKNPAAGKAERQHREFTEDQIKASILIVDEIAAALATSSYRARLVSWGRVIRGTGRGLPKAELDRAWAAFHKACERLALQSNELSAEIKLMEPLPFPRVQYDKTTDELLDKTDGTLL